MTRSGSDACSAKPSGIVPSSASPYSEMTSAQLPMPAALARLSASRRYSGVNCAHACVPSPASMERT